MKCSGTITQRVNENLCPNMEYKEKRLIILIVGFFVARLEIRKNFFSHRVIDLYPVMLNMQKIQYSLNNFFFLTTLFNSKVKKQQ